MSAPKPGPASGPIPILLFLGLAVFFLWLDSRPPRVGIVRRLAARVSGSAGPASAAPAPPPSPALAGEENRVLAALRALLEWLASWRSKGSPERSSGKTREDAAEAAASAEAGGAASRPRPPPAAPSRREPEAQPTGFVKRSWEKLLNWLGLGSDPQERTPAQPFPAVAKTEFPSSPSRPAEPEARGSPPEQRPDRSPHKPARSGDGPRTAQPSAGRAASSERTLAEEISESAWKSGPAGDERPDPSEPAERPVAASRKSAKPPRKKGAVDVSQFELRKATGQAASPESGPASARLSAKTTASSGSAAPPGAAPAPSGAASASPAAGPQTNPSGASPALAELQDDIAAGVNLNAETGSYRVQVATSPEFSRILFDDTFLFMDETDLEEDIRKKVRAAGHYYVRVALIDLLEFQHPYSPPRRYYFGPKGTPRQ